MRRRPVRPQPGSRLDPATPSRGTDNGLWAYAVLLRLYRDHGVRDVCMAPGSRSAPLALAAVRLAAEQPDVTLHTHFDERGLGYFALGLAKAQRRPVAVVTTSGTAVANLHPALAEAFADHRPLVALTADRPAELHGCGSNQTIEQAGIFATHVRAELRLPAPDPTWSLARLNAELDSVLRALHGPDAGPVHVNLPFPEPLYSREAAIGTLDAGDEEPVLGPATATVGHDPLPPPASGPAVIVAGHLEPDEAAGVLDAARRLRIPVLADIGSQLRLVRDPCVVESPDLLLASPGGREALHPVRQVLQFGGRITGKRLGQWLAGHRGERYLVSRHSGCLDPERSAIPIQADIAAFCRRLDRAPQPDLGLSSLAQGIAERVGQWLSGPLSEPAAARVLSESIPPGMALMAGNSLPIRLLDSFARPGAGNPCVTNRGASGIDGLVATASGFARGHRGGLTLLIGDLSLLHDLNSLALAARSTVPLVVVVLNNDGGAIFSLLPAQEHVDSFDRVFRLPHGFGFRHAAAQFGIAYAAPASASEFRAVYADATARAGCSLIELHFEPEATAAILRGISDALGRDVDRGYPL